MFRAILLSFVMLATLTQAALAADKGTVMVAIMPGAQLQRAWDIIPVKTWAASIGRYRGEATVSSEEQARQIASDRGAEWVIGFYGFEESYGGGGGGFNLPNGVRIGGQSDGPIVKIHLFLQEVVSGDIVLTTFGSRPGHKIDRWQGELAIPSFNGNAYGWGTTRSAAIEAAAGRLPLFSLPTRGPSRVAGTTTTDVALPVLADGPIPGTPLTIQHLKPWRVVFSGPKGLDVNDFWLGIPAQPNERAITWHITGWEIIEGDQGKLILPWPGKGRPWPLTLEVKWKGVKVGVFHLETTPPGE